MSSVFKCNRVELGKRTYTGVEITQDCRNTKCDNKVAFDGYRDYLCHPVIGEKHKLYMYCNECGEEWQLNIRLDMTLTILED